MTSKSRKTGHNWLRAQYIFERKMHARGSYARDKKALRKEKREFSRSGGDSAPVTERKRRSIIPRLGIGSSKDVGKETPKSKLRLGSSKGGKFKLGGSKK